MLFMTLLMILPTNLQITAEMETSDTTSYDRSKRSLFKTKNDKQELTMKLLQMEENGTLADLENGFITYTFNSQIRRGSSDRSYMYYDMSNGVKTENKANIQRSNRTISKRFYVHRADERFLITGYQRRQFPYSNVVRLSTGCTGTLLTPDHVLTAAHCVHDGNDFRQNVEMLKIEVPDKIGYRLHYIRTIKISVKWIKSQKLPEAGKGAYDYAILQLNLPVRRRAKFMQMAIPDINKLVSSMHFFGFFSTESSGMWESTCSTADSLVLMHQNVALAECDSAAGNSGAAVFIENARDGQKIIGVLSNTISDKEETEYSSIMLLTLSKALDICSMIQPEADEYSVCTIVKRQNMHDVTGPKRIVPFFGK